MRQAAQHVPPPPKKRGPKPKRLTEKKIWKKGVKGIDWYRYQKLILLPHLYPFDWKIKSLRGQAVLMEDGAGPHSHHFLAELRDEEGIEQEAWPSSSPDINPIEINPIEILWTGMKDDIAARRPKVTKIKQLRQALVEEWESIPQVKIDTLINSMPARIKACIKDKGGNNFNH